MAERRISIQMAAALAFAAAFCAPAADKDAKRFSPGPVGSYSSRQTNEEVTVAAQPYDSEEMAHTAFGKMNPYAHGVLPILVLIQNDTGKTLRLDHLSVEYITADGRRVEPTPAKDVTYIGVKASPSQPGAPLPGMGRKHKAPLGGWEIEGRAFTPAMLPPHQEAHGFFYFQAQHMSGSRLYLTGIQDARTGKEIFYFEIPLERKR